MGRSCGWDGLWLKPCDSVAVWLCGCVAVRGVVTETEAVVAEAGEAPLSSAFAVVELGCGRLALFAVAGLWLWWLKGGWGCGCGSSG